MSASHGIDVRVDVHVDVRFGGRFDGRFDVVARWGGAAMNALHIDPAPLVASPRPLSTPLRRGRPPGAGPRGVARAVAAADLGALPSCLR